MLCSLNIFYPIQHLFYFPVRSCILRFLIKKKSVKRDGKAVSDLPISVYLRSEDYLKQMLNTVNLVSCRRCWNSWKPNRRKFEKLLFHNIKFSCYTKLKYKENMAHSESVVKYTELVLDIFDFTVRVFFFWPVSNFIFHKKLFIRLVRFVIRLQTFLPCLKLYKWMKNLYANWWITNLWWFRISRVNLLVQCDCRSHVLTFFSRSIVS